MSKECTKFLNAFVFVSVSLVVTEDFPEIRPGTCLSRAKRVPCDVEIHVSCTTPSGDTVQGEPYSEHSYPLYRKYTS